PTRGLRVAGLAGIFGGLLWAGLGQLRQQSLDGPLYGLTHDQMGLATPVAAILLVVLLQAAHRLHIARAGRVERRGYRLALTGLSVAVLAVVIDRWLLGEQSPPN